MFVAREYKCEVRESFSVTDVVEALLNPMEYPELCPSEVSEDLSYDDESSLSSFSTTISDDDNHRVHFPEQLVTQVNTRPRTLQRDLGKLYYTYEETQRFRQEYRAERKQQAQTESKVAEENAVRDINDSSSSTMHLSKISLSPLPVRRRHHISRVVVEHNDVQSIFEHNDCGLDARSNAFFDNDSFWSGSITWY